MPCLTSAPLWAALALVPFLCVQGRPLDPIPFPHISLTSAAKHQSAIQALGGSQVPARASTMLRRALLAPSSESDSSWMLDSQEIADQFAAAAALLVAELTKALGLPQASMPALESAVMQFGDSIIPPLVESLRSHQQELEEIVNITMAALPFPATAEDWVALMQDPAYQEEVFVFFNAIFTQDLQGAFKAATEVFAGEMYDIYKAEGLLPSSSLTRNAVISVVMAYVDELFGVLDNLEAFQQTLGQVAVPLSLLLAGAQ